MSKVPCKVVAIEHLTLDGVYQAPARADEDTRGGFRYGGWSAAGDAAETQTVISRYMTRGWSLLVGTATYEDLYEGWHQRQPSHPITKALTDVRKFVVSRKPGYDLQWENSILLSGEGIETVSNLKAEHEKTLIIFGSGALVRSLMRARLVDDFVLMIHPVVLGEGRRLFDDAAPFTKFTLADRLSTDTGVIVAIYRQSAA